MSSSSSSSEHAGWGGYVDSYVIKDLQSCFTRLPWTELWFFSLLILPSGHYEYINLQSSSKLSALGAT